MSEYYKKKKLITQDILRYLSVGNSVIARNSKVLWVIDDIESTRLLLWRQGTGEKKWRSVSQLTRDWQYFPDELDSTKSLVLQQKQRIDELESALEVYRHTIKQLTKVLAGEVNRRHELVIMLEDLKMTGGLVYPPKTYEY